MPAAMDKLTTLDAEVKSLRQEVQKLSKEFVSALGKIEAKLNSLSLAPASGTCQSSAPAHKAAGDAVKKETAEKKDDEDIDLFGSDEEEEDPEAVKRREERLAAYEAKKAKKPALIAKSMIILDVKPWDDETDVKEMETKVRSIQTDGLIWGTSKFVEVAYGIKKLQITCVVEDDKVGTDYLEEQITGFEDLVQSVDIVAFNKI
ncbi:elongation factor 1-delta-like [Paramacrobiotus metropolitanus]|uniref:elongation factor 1-delta-like n=1 Tax=Paramacrobiotus metropolitanus TaxID=2943436 RepID=UPI0024461EF7|nr:elongation factor 1-delta-like [Paramacrobiotus metropolitanus]